MKLFEVTREIGIDAAHRVPQHGSKCKNLHGHRYRIEATVVCFNLAPQGEQMDMGIDFGFLKEIMMERIDKPCDHGTMLWKEDPLLQTPSTGKIIDLIFGKLLILPFTPTAERLAQYWFEQMRHDVMVRSNNQAALFRVKVWETPNCWATFEENNHA